MNQNAAIAGTYSDLKFVKSRKVAQVIVEIPIEQASQFTAMFGTPNPAEEVWVGIARLHADPSPVAAHAEEQPSAPTPDASRRRWDDMTYAQQAGIACGEPEFREFLAAHYSPPNSVPMPTETAEWLRIACRVRSRREFDTDETAAERWRTLYGEYKRWRAGQREAESQVREYGR